MGKGAAVEPAKSILVVDDDSGIRGILDEALSRRGYRVTTSRDGVEAVKRLGERSYDVVITDINMPGMGGIDLLRWMKRHRRKEPVVVVTGSVQQDLRPGMGLALVRMRFRKPFKIAVLAAALEEMFARDDEDAGSRWTPRRKGAA